MKIPIELTERRQWVVWKPYKHSDKFPWNARTHEPAESNNPETWASFDEARAVVDQYLGIGYVFSHYDDYFGVDLDGCRADGKLTDWAREVVVKFGTYTEVSPSGTGVKLFCKGRYPFDSGKNKKLDVPAM